MAATTMETALVETALVETANVKSMRDMLGQTFQVSISDGRVILGNFECVDQEKNLILSNAREISTGRHPCSPPGVLLPCCGTRGLLDHWSARPCGSSL